MNIDMTQGATMKSMLRFALPMILGNLLQQCYNIADTLIVGRFLGPNALAAVGSSFTLMTFLTSILLGLCLGSGAFFSMRFGEGDEKGLKEGICASFALIFSLTLIINLLVFLFLNQIRIFLQVPNEVWAPMRSYLAVIFCGIFATFLYNYFASLLRAIGNSVVPLLFLSVSALLNIALDLWFVIGLQRGVAGAAEATVIAQYVSGIGIALYSLIRVPCLKLKKGELRVRWSCMKEISGFSLLTCVQQSVMNLGILLVQGVVNSFGPVVMAAFAAAVKIDAFAICPCRILEMPFPHLSRKITAQRRQSVSAQAFAAPLLRQWFSVLSFQRQSGCLPARLCYCLSRRRKLPLSRKACAICASKARSIAVSAACFYCTDFTAHWEDPACRSYSQSFRLARASCLHTSSPPFPQSALSEFGGQCRLDGF